ncbi:MAG: hypothetical protein PHF57_05745, partial [Methanoregula sp.]|nr:hypothetical protein [Methanoregula sp.]
MRIESPAATRRSLHVTLLHVTSLHVTLLHVTSLHFTASSEEERGITSQKVRFVSVLLYPFRHQVSPWLIRHTRKTL